MDPVLKVILVGCCTINLYLFSVKRMKHFVSGDIMPLIFPLQREGNRQ
jgi:hypothetical protein